MKKLGFIVIGLVILMVGYISIKPLSSYSRNLIYYSPCDVPKTYHIGSIDPKYNMSTQEFLSHLSKSEDIWENNVNKNLFAYDAEGDIEVNLVYDERQFLNTQISDLNSKVKEKLNALDPQIADYKKRAEAFKVKINQLNNDIEYWNSRGGAPPEEYEKLRSRQESLRQEAISLQQEAESLNQSTDAYNTHVGELRQTVDNFNQQLTFKPEEGEYVYDNGKETINIYFENTDSELVHTLAHELGHALGITHNNNSLSIMYPLTTEALTLSIDDRAGLDKACEEINVMTQGIEKFALIINQLRLRLTQ